MDSRTIDLRRTDSERIYHLGFERRSGHRALLHAMANHDDWDVDLSEKLYDIYLAHIRHVIAARRDIAYFRDLSEHMLRVRDCLKRSNPPLSRQLGVLEDLVDEALAALPSLDQPRRSRKHIAELLTTLSSVSSMKRAELRRRHELGDANTSRILRGMEEEGLVARRQYGRDVSVEITAAGREELAAALGRNGIVAPAGRALDLDADSDAEALTNFVRARLSLERLNDEADADYPMLFGRDLGATLARYCGSGSQGERKFAQAWARIIATSTPSLDSLTIPEPVSAGRLRLALMSLLQCYAREAADTNALLVRRSSAQPKRPLLKVVLDLGQGHWADALRTAQQLGKALLLYDGMPPPILLIGISGYHEERILAKLASDIFLLENGYEGLQLASSPWANEGRVEGVHERFSELVGPADVRLVQAIPRPRRDLGEFKWSAVFKHIGYRAFANAAWLSEQMNDENTPQEVRDWIRALFDEGQVELSAENRPQRAWLCLKGGPVNYGETTEFASLFEHLKKNSQVIGNLRLPLETPNEDPDDVLERFILGESSVLLSGSIHDLLLEDYWISHRREFVKLLDKADFHDWYDSNDAGVNYIKFSSRFSKHPEIEELTHRLYVQVLQAILAIARSGSEDLRRALFTYIATILAPTHRENWDTSATDTRWSFAGSLDSIGRLLLDELELCGVVGGTLTRQGATWAVSQRQ